MKLYIIRHGKALSIEEARVSTDAERPLSEEGKKDIRNLAQYLKSQNAHPEIIFSSPLLRALQTAKELSAILKPSSGIEKIEALNGQTPINILWEIIQKKILDKNFQEIALVGHKPFLREFQLGELVSWLTKTTPPDLKAGGVIALELQNQNTAHLLWNWNKNP